jgi:hypothetical protein
MTRHHADTCEAEADHDYDCGTMTELARLRAFAEMIRDEIGCVCRHQQDADDCFHCAAEQALERAR